MHAFTLKTWAMVGSAAAALCAGPAWAQAPGTLEFNIAPASLDASLRQFAIQSGREVIFNPDLVSGRRTNGLQGALKPDDGLRRLLAGSGLSYQITGPRTFVVQKAGATLTAAALRQPIAVQGPPVAPSPTLAPPAEEPALVNEVVVIGSRIAGAKVTGNLPVSVLDADQLRAQGVVSAGELIATLPQGGAQAFNSGVQGPNNARGDVSSANLRGLGSGNTLVLLDGRRMTPHPTSQQEGGTVPVQIVNLNAIPTSALRRVEVLRDGASALYGSDATAGVLNFVIDRRFTGAEVSARLGGVESGSLRENDVNMKWGAAFNGGATHVALFGEIYHNTDMPGSDRDYAATDDLSGRVSSTYASLFNRTVSQSPWLTGRVSTPVTGLGASFTTFFMQPCSFTGSRAQTATPNVCVNGGSSTLPSSLRSDEGPLRTMVPRTTRGSVMATVDHDFAGGVSAFGDLLYYKASAWAGRGGSTTLTDAPLVVSRNNPYNPFGSGPGRLASYTGPAQDVTIVGYDVLDVGMRNFDVDNTQIRAVAGLRGRIGDWRWDTSAVYSRAKTVDTEHNRVSNTALQAALSSSDPATAYNPFNGGDPANLRVGDSTLNSAAVLDRLRIDVTRDSRTSLAMWSAGLSNPSVLTIAGRDIGLASGVEARRETYDDYRDPRINGTISYVTATGARTSDVMGNSQTLDTHGKRNVYSAYAELQSAIIRPSDGVPLVQSFDVQLAARYERYSDTKDEVLKPKVAASWGVTDWLKFRASYSEAFRAPNLEQINAAAANRVQQNQLDLYACGLAQGAKTVAAINRSNCAAYRYDVSETRSGNDRLKAENSKSTSAGVVLTPVRNLTVTLDWWRIKQTGLVGVFSTQDQIYLDAIRRLGGGEGNPLVTRDASGKVTSVRAIFENLNSREVEATDIGVAYRIPTDRYGDFRLNADVSIFGRFYQSPSESAAALLAAGLSTTSGGSQIGLNGNPRSRATASLVWAKDGWQVTGSGTYIDGIYDTSALNFPVSSWTTFNTAVRKSFDDGALSGGSIRVGVNNIADKDPPLANQLFGYFTSLYSARGRFWYLEMTKSF
ncbi:TonB-dependent receptor [Caulobacter sp. UC70_42]|uniref:TonB-dependent receptor n=1 Tax=Caulobacter sp. UC70_42 TaxID=3374551 RepID=UPI003756D31C